MHICSYFQVMPSRTGRHRGLTEPQLEAVARRFRALGVPSRLRILDKLMRGPAPMAELSEATGLSQSNLSRQVTELELAGVVRRTRTGREVEVEICDPTISELCELVCGSLRRQAETNRALLRG